MAPDPPKFHLSDSPLSRMKMSGTKSDRQIVHCEITDLGGVASQ